jgi:hypothetical protein
MISRLLLFATFAAGCTNAVSGVNQAEADLSQPGGDGSAITDGGTGSDGGTVGPCGSPADCATAWEANAGAKYQAALNDPTALAAFLKAVPKGGDLHNHLTGAVYAETYLGWATTDGDCVNNSSFSVVTSGQCSATNVAIPAPGALYDQIVDAWSMKDFVAGAENGHDHFFATFGKYGTVAGLHRDDDIADVLTRAAGENQVYVETMFNLGKNVGALAAKLSTTTVTQAGLETLYDAVIADSTFATEVNSDVAVVTSAASNYKGTLGCAAANPPAACGVEVRFIAQISRTGALDTLFGQLISAYEMAAKSPNIVAANLSSPEDDSTSLKNYDLHMQMLDFLYNKYTATQKSPLHITLHAGELVPQYLPAGSTDNTFHVREAVEVGHAERIGHGVDILSETDPSGLMDEMKTKNVMVEVCLSSNAQILEVSGANHPLSQYLQHGVAAALATDDQGVSRSSLAGEYARAATDQKLSYHQLKTMARNSLEHAFLPGASVWSALDSGTPVADCAPTDTMGVGDPPNAGCQTFLNGSERAKLQWELERRFLAFESKQ